jgi:hypothetical protein
VNVLCPGYGVFHPALLAELDELLESASLTLIAAVSALHSLPSQLLQLTILLADCAGRWRTRCTAARAQWRRLERGETRGAGAHRWRSATSSSGALQPIIQRPVARIIREAMPMDVADVIEHDRRGLAWRRPEHSADLLQVEPERLGGAEEDGAACCWDVEAFAHHIDGDEHLQLTGGKASDRGIAPQWIGGAQQRGGGDAGRIE